MQTLTINDPLADLTRTGSIFHLPPTLPDVIPTGFPTLDRALGVGGLPRGRIIDVRGPESSGKTSLCLSTIAQAQATGGHGCIIDLDRTIDPVWCTRWGIDPERLYISQPKHAEEGLEIADAMIRAGCDVVVIDSTAALCPRNEIKGKVGDVWGNHGSLMSQALRKLAGPVSKSGSVLIFVNQLRVNQNVLFGNPEKTTGARALNHYSSVAIDLRVRKRLKNRNVVIGNHVRATVKKSKLAAPFRTAEIEIGW